MAIRKLVYLTISRYASTLNARLEPVRGPAPIPGSPDGGWPCLLYRAQVSTTIGRQEEAQGVVTVDRIPVCSVRNAAAGVQINDLVTLPGGAVVKVIRVRPYENCLQCDLEEGTQI